MLVINANNQQNTTNYMLADPWYPDLDSILMRGGPQRIQKIVIGSNSVTVDMGWLEWQAVVDTIGTEPINYYCPKFYKQGLLWGKVTKTPIYYTNTTDYLIDYWINWQPSSTNYELTTNNYKYRIAVKWLQNWQIIWEKIFAPLLFSIAGINASWRIYNSVNFGIEFWLLHADWTKTVIANIVPTYITWTQENTDTTTYIVGQTTTQGMYNTALMVGTYNWVWQTAQNGDILYATVDLSGIKWRPWTNWRVGIFFWGTNNVSPWDLDWFRPFQVSIRDS